MKLKNKKLKLKTEKTVQLPLTTKADKKETLSERQNPIDALVKIETVASVTEVLNPHHISCNLN